MKLVKKIAFVSVFAMLICGSIFAKGNKDSEEKVSEEQVIQDIEAIQIDETAVIEDEPGVAK